MSLTSTLFGRKLANREAEGRKIGAFEGVPAMGLDGLGSASYGPEAMLTVLAALGTAGLAAVQPITWAILLLLLLLLFLSYWQTIAAYPSNGASYTVARENLGADAGLLAAAALMVDYMLNGRRRHLGGHRRADLRPSRPAFLHPAALSGHAGGHHRSEPAAVTPRRSPRRLRRPPPPGGSPSGWSCAPSRRGAPP